MGRWIATGLASLLNFIALQEDAVADSFNMTRGFTHSAVVKVITLGGE